MVSVCLFPSGSEEKHWAERDGAGRISVFFCYVVMLVGWFGWLVARCRNARARM